MIFLNNCHGPLAVIDSKQNNVSLNVLPRDYFSLNRMVTLCYRKIMQMEDYIMIGCLNLYPYQRKYSLYVWSGDTWHWAQHMSVVRRCILFQSRLTMFRLCV